jgi:hypothetical protein
VPLSNLIARFRFGLYKFYPSWKEPLTSLFVVFLDAAQSEDIETSTTSIAALKLLPGLLEFSRRRSKATLSPINMLKTILACPHKASETIRLASNWFKAFPLRPLVERNPPTHEDLRARIESLTQDNRLSAAAKVATFLDKSLAGAPPPLPMNRILHDATIVRLHPVDDHRDVLPDPADDPVECLQLTADQVRDRIYRVNCDYSSGSTGWTNALLRRLCDDRTSTAARIADTPPLPIHLSLTSFFNKILRCAIPGEGRDLLVGARLLMIPKGIMISLSPDSN